MDGEGHKRPGKLHFPVDFSGEIFTEVISFTEVIFSQRSHFFTDVIFFTGVKLFEALYVCEPFQQHSNIF